MTIVSVPQKVKNCATLEMDNCLSLNPEDDIFGLLFCAQIYARGRL